MCRRSAVTSPTKQCGKTTLLELLSGISARGLPSSNVTAAAIFRTVDKYKPTLILDEADTWMTLSDELRGILNSGHKRSGAWITRNVGDNHEPKLFSPGLRRRWRSSEAVGRQTP